eukprot:7529683-Alexandrium_andersonii.AAC.1
MTRFDGGFRPGTLVLSPGATFGSPIRIFRVRFGSSGSELGFQAGAGASYSCLRSGWGVQGRVW